MATRNKRLFRGCVNRRGYADISPFLSQLVNNIEVYGAAVSRTSPDFIPYVMATEGGIAYVKSVNEWLRFTSVGSECVYGIIPRFVKLWSERKHAWSGVIDLVTDEDVCIFPANALYYSVVDKINDLAVSLNTVEDSISQNLENLRELSLVVVENNTALKTQLEFLNDLRRSGKISHGVINLKRETGDVLTASDAAEKITVLSLSPNANNYLTDYLALKQDYRQELNNVIGVTEVKEKSERRINSEMELIENSSCAFIDMIIDSINKYAKHYGVEVRAHRTHGGCETHTDSNSTEEGGSNKNE